MSKIMIRFGVHIQIFVFNTVNITHPRTRHKIYGINKRSGIQHVFEQYGRYEGVASGWGYKWKEVNVPAPPRKKNSETSRKLGARITASRSSSLNWFYVQLLSLVS